MGTASFELSEAMRQEQTKVRLLAECLGVDTLIEQIAEVQERRFNESRLSFAAFYEVRPDFPVMLTYRHLFKLDRHPRCALKAMLLHPEDSPIYEAWRSFFDATSDVAFDRRPRGVIFPFGGVRGGLIIHNARLPLRATNVRHWRMAFMVRKRVLFIEHFLHFLAGLKDAKWTLGPAHPRRRLIVKSAWLKKAAGAGPKLVLGLLIDVLNQHIERRPAWTRRACLVQRASGCRWVALSHQEIADGCGLTLHQVRRGLRQLRKKKVLVSMSRNGRRLYRLTAFGD